MPRKQYHRVTHIAAYHCLSKDCHSRRCGEVLAEQAQSYNQIVSLIRKEVENDFEHIRKTLNFFSPGPTAARPVGGQEDLGPKCREESRCNSSRVSPSQLGQKTSEKNRRVPRAWVERCELSESRLVGYTDRLTECVAGLDQPNATFWMPAIRNHRPS